MTHLRRFILRLLSFFRINAAETELAREIQSHLQLLEDQFVSQGMDRSEARLAARRAFGGVEQVKEHQRDARGFRWLNDSRVDVKLGARMLVKYPGLSIIGGAGLAVAMAIGTAFFAFFYSYIYAALPVPHGDRIVALENWDLEDTNEMRQALHDFHTWRNELKSFEEIGAFRTIGRNLIVPGGSTEPVQIAQITAAGFNMAEAPPLLGRPLAPSDEAAGAPPVLIIGYDAWQSRFSGDKGIVGREIRIGNIVHTVIGVMPDGFAFPVNHQYWTALNTDTSSFGRRQGPAIFVFGRLREGVTMDQAQSELTALGARAAAQFPDTHARLQPRVLPYAHPILDIQGITTFQFATMQGLVSLALVLVALNVAILIYARTATRQGEIAVRTALGASRRRIVGQLFIEALVLSTVSAIVGVVLARYGISIGHAILKEEGMGLPYFVNLGIPAAAVIYLATLTIFAAIVAGVLPALRATGRGLQASIRQAGSSDGLRLGHTWTMLIVAQVALAVAGLPAAVAQGWRDAQGAMTTTSFNGEQYLAAVLRADPDPPAGIAPEAHTRQATARLDALRIEWSDRVEAEATVADVTISAFAPGDESDIFIEIEGDAIARSGDLRTRINSVDGDYFAAFDAQPISGQGFEPGDASQSAAPVLMVNRAFVAKVMGGGNPIGRRIRFTGAPSYEAPVSDTTTLHEIIGVVPDLQQNTMDPDLVRPVIYKPLRSSGGSFVASIRVRGADAAAVAPRLREITTALDPTVRLSTRTFSELERQNVLAVRLVLLVLGLVITSVLLLSAAGIYALMSFTVSQRRKEIGIRAAMGADAGQLLRSIFSKSARQLSMGIAVGIAVALAIDAGTEVLGSLGRVMLVPMSLVMLIVGLVAAIGPARRGLRVQPTEALRAE